MIDPDDLYVIFPNALDNAIEASKKEKDPEIRVSFSIKGAYLILKISNRISRNILKINPGLITTKKDRKLHGHGISIVKSAVREAGGMLEIRTDNGYFDVTAALPDTGTAAENEAAHA